MIKTSFKLRTANSKQRTNLGSALILTVVLTSILAVIGVLFIMMARVDRMATSAISENKELNFAVEAVVAKISQELILDIPGMPKGVEDYYDYPDSNDAWLASLEPYKNNTDGKYYWRQISDVTGFLAAKGFQIRDVNTEPRGLSTTDVVREYPDITLNNSGVLMEQSADADGDGIADSKWITLDDITSDRGKPIYAAIRIVDNGGMVNVNTAYQFDPNSMAANRIDGSSQMQVDLDGLIRPTDTINDVNDARNPIPHRTYSQYQNEFIWKIEDPCSYYRPFDISDELELKYRYCIDSLFKSRIEANIPDTTEVYGNPGGLYDGSSNWGLSDWQNRITNPSDPCADRRHLLTNYNMDRIIDPNGDKMLNINIADVNVLYNAIIDANLNIVNAKAVAAQVAVNLVDFRDNDSNVSMIDVNGIKYYGFERPCIYISEIVHKCIQVFPPSGPMGAPPVFYQAYAVELYKPYPGDADPCNWRLVIGSAPSGPMGAPPAGTPYYITQWAGNRQLYVMRSDPCDILLGDIDPNAVIESSNFTLANGGNVLLQRCVDEANGVWISVDAKKVPSNLIPAPLAAGVRSCARDINLHKCIRHLWSSVFANQPTLGRFNDNYTDPNSRRIQAHPEDRPFTNVGEIGILFKKSAYSQGPNPVEPNNNEAAVRLNLADPCYQKLFQYLTVFDPYNFYPGDANYAGETRIKGRVNINTAPWFVLAQLPWVARRGGIPDFSLAQAIVAYRDKSSISGGPNYSGRSGEPGFRSIGELNRVVAGGNNYRIDSYALDSADLTGFPDLTTLDHPLGGAPDDFEERDVIFARISNLVTVRSDVFTAYILVRIGRNGPQKRVMAILDRSNPLGGKIRVIALHPVPDPR
jgi:hypothetical protein